jgi:hypothetical protein
MRGDAPRRKVATGRNNLANTDIRPSNPLAHRSTKRTKSRISTPGEVAGVTTATTGHLSHRIIRGQGAAMSILWRSSESRARRPVELPVGGFGRWPIFRFGDAPFYGSGASNAGQSVVTLVSSGDVTLQATLGLPALRIECSNIPRLWGNLFGVGSS